MNLEMIWLKTVNVVKIDLHCVANSVLNQGLLQPETSENEFQCQINWISKSIVGRSRFLSCWSWSNQAKDRNGETVM